MPINNSASSKFGFVFFLILATVGYYAFANLTQEHDEDEIINVNYTYNDNDPTISKTFNLNGPGTLDVVTSGGKITAVGHDGNSVEVNAFVKQNGKVLSGSDNIMSKIEEGFDMTIEKNGSTIVAHAKRKNKGMPWKKMSVSFEVKVPHEMSCMLKTSGGSIKLEDVEGTQQITTSGGSINLQKINGDLDAKTSGGSIRAGNVMGDISLSTSGGTVSIEGGSGKISARTSGGSIKIDDVEANSISAATSGGGIKINAYAKSVIAATSGGSIHTDLQGISDQLSLKTSGGSIHAKIPGDLGMDLNLVAGRVNVDLKNFTGSAKKNSVKGAMNGGGMPVDMTTAGGSVNIDFH